MRFGVDRFLQQTTDNGDQIREIEERVQSLQKLLESPVGNQDDGEKARRNALREYVSTFDKSWHVSKSHWLFAGGWIV